MQIHLNAAMNNIIIDAALLTNSGIIIYLHLFNGRRAEIIRIKLIKCSFVCLSANPSHRSFSDAHPHHTSTVPASLQTNVQHFISAKIKKWMKWGKKIRWLKENLEYQFNKMKQFHSKNKRTSKQFLSNWKECELCGHSFMDAIADITSYRTSQNNVDVQSNRKLVESRG